MMRSFGWIFGSFIFLVAVPAMGQRNAPPRAGSQPSLNETEKWIQQTLSEPQNSFATSKCDDAAHADPSTRCLYVQYQVRFDGCKVKLFKDYVALDESRKSPLNSVVSFNLGDIDPSTIKVDDSDYRLGISLATQVVFRTTDDGNKIKVEYPNDTGTTSNPERAHECCGMADEGIEVIPKYAPRLVQALVHAVKLCGGKPSAF
jgi:hypothetical protein